MFPDETSILLAVEAVCGACGGIAVGRWRNRQGFRISNALAGAIGGVFLTWLAARIPTLKQFVGGVEAALDSTSQSVGGLTLTILVGVGVAGLIGGILAALLLRAVTSSGYNNTEA